MLKINKINILIFFAAALLICGCRTVPQGNPPSEIVNIRQTAENSEPISLAEAVNMAATELAVNVFPQKGEIKILFKRNPVGNEVTRRLYRELKMFLPVKSVLQGENFIIESAFLPTKNGSRIWYVKLKEKSGKVLYHEEFNLKDGELK